MNFGFIIFFILFSLVVKCDKYCEKKFKNCRDGNGLEVALKLKDCVKYLVASVSVDSGDAGEAIYACPCKLKALLKKEIKTAKDDYEISEATLKNIQKEIEGTRETLKKRWLKPRGDKIKLQIFKIEEKLRIKELKDLIDKMKDLEELNTFYTTRCK